MDDYTTMGSEWLEHHGILGMKWGVQNGPPYPLDYNDHSAEEKRKNPGLREMAAKYVEKAKVKHQERVEARAEKKAAAVEKEKADFEEKKQKAIQSGDVDFAHKNYNRLSNQDITDIINRNDMLRKLNDVPPAKIQKGLDTINRMMKYTKLVTDVVGTANNLYDAKEKLKRGWLGGDAEAKRNEELKKQQEEEEKNRFKITSENYTRNEDGTISRQRTSTQNGTTRTESWKEGTPTPAKDKITKETETIKDDGSTLHTQTIKRADGSEFTKTWTDPPKTSSSQQSASKQAATPKSTSDSKPSSSSPVPKKAADTPVADLPKDVVDKGKALIDQKPFENPKGSMSTGETYFKDRVVYKDPVSTSLGDGTAYMTDKKWKDKFKHDAMELGKEWLEHHGILGQKWGIQNGPPYPLDQEDHSAAELKRNSFKDHKDSKEKTSSKKYNHDKVYSIIDSDKKGREAAIRTVSDMTFEAMYKEAMQRKGSLKNTFFYLTKYGDVDKMSKEKLKKLNRQNDIESAWRATGSSDHDIIAAYLAKNPSVYNNLDADTKESFKNEVEWFKRNK